MKKIFLILLLPFLASTQVFTIDDNYIEFSDNYNLSNFSANTFLNTLADLTISYEVIVDSMPSGWDFQNCFPTCYPINTYSIDPISFPADSSVYLNGHFYPNNIIGEGLIVMELSAQHGLYLDTVSWRGEAVMGLDLEEGFFYNSNFKTIHNIGGQVVKDFSCGNIFVVVFEDNTTKTYYVIK
tara:strand:+ start:294 stop:842 length:549 start_codon:yes stop_codon:yes gene_type:complete